MGNSIGIFLPSRVEVGDTVQVSDNRYVRIFPNQTVDPYKNARIVTLIDELETEVANSGKPPLQYFREEYEKLLQQGIVKPNRLLPPSEIYLSQRAQETMNEEEDFNRFLFDTGLIDIVNQDRIDNNLPILQLEEEQEEDLETSEDVIYVS